MGKWTLERWIAVAAIVLSVGAYVQVLKETRDSVQKLQQFNEDKLPKEYVPREVYNLDRMHLTDSIDRLNGTLNKLLELEEKTGEPVRIQRQFDR